MSELNFGPLYAKATNGKIKMWLCKVYEQGERVFLKVSHGYEDGKQADDVREVFGKNIGKKNESTSWSQACFDANSKMTKKKDQGYVENISDIKAEMFLPMLAHKFQDRKHYLKYPCFVQPKLNGVRCLTKTNEYISRGGKLFTTLSNMNRDVNIFLAFTQSSGDGEIFHPEYTFQEIISAIKKENEHTPNLQYWIYDIVDKTKTFEQRMDTIRSYFDMCMELDWTGAARKAGCLCEVPTYQVLNEDDIFFYHKEFTEKLGFEGTIIRNKNGIYMLQHRSNDLLKYKDFIDEEFEIVGAESATGNDIGTAVFKCKTKDGRIFDVRPKGSRELRRRYLNEINSLIGKMLTVKFQNYSDEGTPIFGVGIAIRDYE